MVCVNFIHVWQEQQFKVDFLKDRFSFGKLFHANFILFSAERYFFFMELAYAREMFPKFVSNPYVSHLNSLAVICIMDV